MRKICVAALCCAALSGCATIINGSSQQFAIKSDPPGAAVKLSSGQDCTTPCSLKLERSRGFQAVLSKPGYKNAQANVQSKFGGTMVGNILLGGVVGAVVDSSSGASRFLMPNPLHVRLAAMDSTEEAVLLDKNGKVIETLASGDATPATAPSPAQAATAATSQVPITPQTSASPPDSSPALASGPAGKPTATSPATTSTTSGTINPSTNTANH